MPDRAAAKQSPIAGQAGADGWLPFFPTGAEVIFLVGDPLRGAGYMYVEFSAAYAPPLHAHTATERI
jgi:hypothetical protein